MRVQGTPGKHDSEVCQSKIAYATRNDAIEAGERSRRVGKELTEYKCSVCGCWHLTRVIKPARESFF